MTDQPNSITIDASSVPSQPSHDFDGIWRAANAFAGSEMVPEHFTNKPQNCFVVIQLALELGISPFTALQNISMIKGKPYFSASLVRAMANKSGVFAGPIRYKTDHGDGKWENLSVTAYAPLNDGDVAEVTVSMQMAIKDGWTKNGKYKSLPEQMLRNRASKWLIDLHCPEILFGLDIADPGGRLTATKESGKVAKRDSEGLSLQDALLKQNDQPVQSVVITQGDPEEPALINHSGEVCPAPALAEKSEENDGTAKT